jgi:hypothetical protein
LQSLLRKIVNNLTIATFISRQWQNLAVRMVYESKLLSKKTKQHFFRNLLYTDEEGKNARTGVNGGTKIQQWFLKCVFGTSLKKVKEIDPDNRETFVPHHTGGDPLEGFLRDGQVDDIQRVLSAFPGDPYLQGLHKSYEDNEIMGNIILAARKLWHHGFNGKWEELPEFPTSMYLSQLIEELSRTLDKDTAANITTNFLGYQQNFLSHYLEELDSELLKEKAAPELFSYLINMLPIDDRPDLIKLRDKLKVETSLKFNNFISHQRKELAVMMGVDEIYQAESILDIDDNRVDMRLALGFGEHKCVQADFLLPAILGMATKVDMSVVIIPDAGVRNRFILFNSRATETLMRNLNEYATKYQLDLTIANEIKSAYIKSTSELGDSPEHDLTSISFLIDVSNMIICCIDISSVDSNG